VRYVKDKFSPIYKATIGADFLTKEIFLHKPEETLVTLQVEHSRPNSHTPKDLGHGRPREVFVNALRLTERKFRFQTLGVAFYRGSDAAFLVFDVTNRKSFDALLTWKAEFLLQVGEAGNEDFPFVVLANKIDRGDRVVSS
jgi:Ras-related protein Rab-7A